MPLPKIITYISYNQLIQHTKKVVKEIYTDQMGEPEKGEKQRHLFKCWNLSCLLNHCNLEKKSWHCVTLIVFIQSKDKD